MTNMGKKVTLLQNKISVILSGNHSEIDKYYNICRLQSKIIMNLAIATFSGFQESSICRVYWLLHVQEGLLL